MPKDFDRCIKDGGKVRRKTLPDGRYINICYLDGKSYAGEAHEKAGDKLRKAVVKE